MPAEAAFPANGGSAWGRLRRSAWWPRATRWLGIVFMVLVLGLVVELARAVDWHAAFDAVRRLPAPALLAAGALAACSHLLYSTYDLLGRRQTQHPLSVPRTMGVGFVSYAFNLNLGSLVGGVALRYRLYSSLGLRTGVVTRVLVLSLLTNWLGYLVLGGSVLVFWPPELPPEWPTAQWMPSALGAAMLLAAALYFAACFVHGGRKWKPSLLGGRQLLLPTGRVALLQLAMSTLNWMLMAGAVWLLLQQRIAYPTVLETLLVGAIAGVLTHVPAGLGVLEAVFVALLSSQLAEPELLGALLAYRALYYLAPLLIASALFFVVHGRAGQVQYAAAAAKKEGGRSRP